MKIKIVDKEINVDQKVAFFYIKIATISKYNRKHFAIA
jgi:hypothetical protein